jgi:uncharacterized protein
MKKKISFPAIVLYFLGLILMSIGIPAMIKSNMGITVVTSFPYSISVITGLFTIGRWVTIFQCVVLIIAIIVLKRITVSMVTSFATAALLGLFIDFFVFVFDPIVIESLVMRVLTVIISSTVMATGAGILIFSGFPPIPDLVFLRDVSKEKNIEMGRLKQYFDLSVLVMTVSLTLIVLKRIIGVGIGTVISFAIVGFVIGFVNKVLNKYALSKNFMDEDKLNGILEFNLLSLFSKKA